MQNKKLTLTATDQENAEKAAQTAALLVSDLQELHRTGNPLLAKVAYDLLKEAAKLKGDLVSLDAILRETT